jgi:hypothetical protein
VSLGSWLEVRSIFALDLPAFLFRIVSNLETPALAARRFYMITLFI